jgi:putative transcriptional regulator
LRVYAGYAGWAPGQLQAEIALGGWFVIQAEPEIIFSADPAGVWEALIRRLAGRRAHGSLETQSELAQATP